MLRFGTLCTLALASLCCHACARAGARSAEVASQAAATPGAPAQVATEELAYEAGPTHMKGHLAYPQGVSEPRPGVLVVHEWWGLNEYARMRARMLAELGYVALAVDLYGEGKATEHAADAKQLAGALMQAGDEPAQRLMAAEAALRANRRVDPNKIAAIGYCMGGAVVLGMARKGAELDAVASFHGNYATQTPMQPGAFAGRMFIAHGAADSFAPPEQVEAFKRELDAAGARYEFVAYPDAKHGFTNPGATELGQKNGLDLAYNADADAQSWAKLRELLAAAFAAS